MDLSPAHKVVIACLAIFATIVLLLLVFCLYSSRRATREENAAHKAVLGRWKESPDVEFGLTTSGSGKGSERGRGRGRGAPPVPPIPDRLRDDLCNRESIMTLTSVKSGHSRRRSGMAGVGTLAYKTSVKSNGSKSSLSEAQGSGPGAASGSKPRPRPSPPRNPTTERPRDLPPSRPQNQYQTRTRPPMAPRGEPSASGLSRGHSHSRGLPPLRADGIVRARSNGKTEDGRWHGRAGSMRKATKDEMQRPGNGKGKKGNRPRAEGRTRDRDQDKGGTRKKGGRRL